MRISAAIYPTPHLAYRKKVIGSTCLLGGLVIVCMILLQNMDHMFFMVRNYYGMKINIRIFIPILITLATIINVGYGQGAPLFIGNSIFLNNEFFFKSFSKIGYSKCLPDYEEFRKIDYAKRHIKVRIAVPSDNSYCKKTFFDSSGYIVKDEWYSLRKNTLRLNRTVNYYYENAHSIITIKAKLAKNPAELNIQPLIKESEVVKLLYDKDGKIDSATCILIDSKRGSRITISLSFKYDNSSRLLSTTLFSSTTNIEGGYVIANSKKEIEKYSYYKFGNPSLYVNIMKSFFNKINFHQTLIVDSNSCFIMQDDINNFKYGYFNFNNNLNCCIKSVRTDKIGSANLYENNINVISLEVDAAQYSDKVISFKAHLESDFSSEYSYMLLSVFDKDNEDSKGYDDTEISYAIAKNGLIKLYVVNKKYNIQYSYK